MKIVSITGECIINDSENTLVAKYKPINFVGDPRTYYKLMGFQYNEMCSECNLDEDEKRNSCMLYKRAMNYQE